MSELVFFFERNCGEITMTTKRVKLLKKHGSSCILTQNMIFFSKPNPVVLNS